MLAKTLAKFVFYTVAVVLFAWTANLTVSFISLALPASPWYVPLFGLVVFDGGLLAWSVVFIHYAQGSIQRAVALTLTVFNLIGVSLMTISEVLLGGQQLAQAPALLGTFAIWAIGVWTVVNVAGLIMFHLGDPAARKAMAIQAEKDAIWDGALASLQQRRIADQQRLARELSDVMFAEMLAELRTDNPNATVAIPAYGVATSGNAAANPYPGLTDAAAADIRLMQPVAHAPVATPVATPASHASVATATTNGTTPPVATGGDAHPNG